jgi:hypothetical protein
MFSLFSSLLDKFSPTVKVRNSRVNSPNHRQVNIALIVINRPVSTVKELESEFAKQSVIIQQEAATVTARAGTQKVETKQSEPTEEEVAIIKKFINRKPYNHIDNIKINKDNNGNIISVQWDET